MATIIDIKLPRAIATALRIPQNDPQRQQIRVLKKLLKKARFTEFGQHFMVAANGRATQGRAQHPAHHAILFTDVWLAWI